MRQASELCNACGTPRDAAQVAAHRLRLLSDIGLALSAERDIHRLLDLILSKARELTGADAGSIYTVSDDTNDDKQPLGRRHQSAFSRRAERFQDRAQYQRHVSGFLVQPGRLRGACAAKCCASTMLISCPPTRLIASTPISTASTPIAPKACWWCR